MTLKSVAAKVFLFLAGLYALMTMWETYRDVLFLIDSDVSPSETWGRGFALVGRWAIDPVFLATAALTIEMLERIWLALRARESDGA